MRTKFDEQLNQLHVDLIKMGSLCEEAITLAAQALLREPGADPQKVFSLETEIDQLEWEIESHCMRLLLRQQPMACLLYTSPFVSFGAAPFLSPFSIREN